MQLALHQMHFQFHLMILDLLSNEMVPDLQSTLVKVLRMFIKIEF